MTPEISDLHLRETLIEDISVLAEHHRKMFEEIWEKKSERLEAVIAGEIEKAYAHKLKTEMNRGVCKAWVIEDQGETVSSGGIKCVSLVPNPHDLSSKVACLHSMYTEKSHRNRKCAQRIIQIAISYCSSRGVHRIILNASDAGKPVYEKIGFRSAAEMMRLLIQKDT